MGDQHRWRGARVLGASTHLLQHARRYVRERDGLVTLANICCVERVQIVSVYARVARRGLRTLEHVLDENTALSDLLIDDELLIVGCDEENHV